ELDRVRATTTWRHVSLHNGAEPPRLPPALVRRLPGFPGYTLLSTVVDAVVDTRDEELHFTGQSGLRFELMGGFHVDPASPGLRFARYGGEASAFWNVGWNNVLGASVFMQLTENVSERIDGRRRPIPFTEKVM